MEFGGCCGDGLPDLLRRARNPCCRSGFSREKRQGREGVVLFSDGPGFREHLNNFAKLASFAAKAASPACVLLMQRRRLHGAIGYFIRCRITHGGYLDVVGNHFTCKWMIAINGELAVLDVRHPEHPGFAFIVLKLDLGADVPEFRRDIIDMIDEGEFGLVFTKTLIRAEFYADFVTLCTAFQCFFHLVDDLAVTSMNIINRHVDAFQDFIMFIGDGVGEGNELVPLDSICHGVMADVSVYNDLFSHTIFQAYTLRLQRPVE